MTALFSWIGMKLTKKSHSQVSPWPVPCWEGICSLCLKYPSLSSTYTKSRLRRCRFSEKQWTSSSLQRSKFSVFPKCNPWSLGTSVYIVFRTPIWLDHVYETPFHKYYHVNLLTVFRLGYRWWSELQPAMTNTFSVTGRHPSSSVVYWHPSSLVVYFLSHQQTRGVTWWQEHGDTIVDSQINSI